MFCKESFGKNYGNPYQIIIIKRVRIDEINRGSALIMDYYKTLIGKKKQI